MRSLISDRFLLRFSSSVFKGFSRSNKRLACISMSFIFLPANRANKDKESRGGKRVRGGKGREGLITNTRDETRQSNHTLKRTENAHSGNVHSLGPPVLHMLGHFHPASLGTSFLPICRLRGCKSVGRGRRTTDVLVIVEFRRRSFVSCTVAFTLDRSTDVLTTLRLKPRTSSRVLVALSLAAAASSLAFLPFSPIPTITARDGRVPCWRLREKSKATSVVFHTKAHANNRFSC